jgi:Flp pilus assembly protein TadB
MKNNNELYEKVKKYIGNLIPERLIGSRKVMQQQVSAACLGSDSSAMIDKIRSQTTAFYLILAIALVASVISILMNIGADTDIPAIERDAFGGEVKRVEAEVEAGYSGERVKKKTTLSIRTKAPETDAVNAALISLKERLPRLILGDNASLGSVVSDLDLISYDVKSGASISWSSDQEDIITDEGAVNLLAAEPGDDVFLTASTRLAGVFDEVQIRVVIGVVPYDYSYGRDLMRSLDGIIEDLNSSEEGDLISLPEQTESGVSLNWKHPAEVTMFIVPPALILFGYLMYRRRYAGVKKAVKAMRESMKLDFPDFLAKLLLLLNAGLVVTSAVARIADDYRARRREGEERVLYEELLGMEARMRAANTSLTAEFGALAMRSGQREIMRFSSILTDNIDKGSALADKLTQEEQALRLVRKRSAEERARVAETKLTFPMALELAAVILITIAPAVMQMKA